MEKENRIRSKPGHEPSTGKDHAIQLGNPNRRSLDVRRNIVKVDRKGEKK